MAKKIFLVVADATLSGAPKHVWLLSKGLNKQQYQPVVVCPNGWLAGQCRENGIAVCRIAMTGLSDRDSIKKLRAAILKGKPALIHCHGLRAGWLGHWACRKLDVPFIYSEHLYTDNYHLTNSVLEWLQLKGLALIARAARRVVAPSRAVERFLRQNIGVQRSRIQIIANGITLRPVKSIDTQELRIGFIGSLNRQKGVRDLIDAMSIVTKRFPNVQLDVIGDGPMKNELMGHASQASVSIKFYGVRGNIDEYLSRWRFLVLPSISESFGQVVLEAARAALPTVATKVGGLKEVVLDSKTGLLVPPRRPDKLAVAIIKLLGAPKATQKMGEYALKNFQKKYTAPIMVRQMSQLYLDVLKP